MAKEPGKAAEVLRWALQLQSGCSGWLPAAKAVSTAAAYAAFTATMPGGKGAAPKNHWSRRCCGTWAGVNPGKQEPTRRHHSSRAPERAGHCTSACHVEHTAVGHRGQAEEPVMCRAARCAPNQLLPERSRPQAAAASAGTLGWCTGASCGKGTHAEYTCRAGSFEEARAACQATRPRWASSGRTCRRR